MCDKGGDRVNETGDGHSLYLPHSLTLLIQSLLSFSDNGNQRMMQIGR